MLVANQRFALPTELVFVFLVIDIYEELKLTIDKVVTICLKELLCNPVSVHSQR